MIRSFDNPEDVAALRGHCRLRDGTAARLILDRSYGAKEFSIEGQDMRVSEPIFLLMAKHYVEDSAVPLVLCRN